MTMNTYLTAARAKLTALGLTDEQVEKELRILRRVYANGFKAGTRGAKAELRHGLQPVRRLSVVE